MKSKILIDQERLRYPFSGIANVFRNLRKGIDSQSHDFDIKYFGNFDENTQQKSWKKWHKFFENFSSTYQLIHVSHQLSSYFHKNYRNTIKIVTLHDLNFLHENLSDRKRNKMIKKVNNNVKHADYLVCISDYAKKDFEENKYLFQLKKLKEIKVIHNGIALPEDRIYDLGKFSFLKDKNYILNIGVLFDKKKQITLVEMLPHLSQDLVLLSSDEKQPYADQLRNRVKELGLDDRVHFIRGLSEEEKYGVIQNCEALCHPSIAEGFGIPPIEAMAFGKPVFLSMFTSLPEIGGDVAYYFKDFDAENMAQIFKEKIDFYKAHQSEEMIKIKKWTLQFDYAVMSKNYLNFYEEVLSKH